MLGDEGFERVLGLVADAARGRVDDAAHGHEVGVVDEEAEVGERVFDFGAVVEGEAADELVGERGGAQRVFNDTGLGVCAEEDRDGRVGWRRGGAPSRDCTGDKAGFFVFVGCTEEGDWGCGGVRLVSP